MNTKIQPKQLFLNCLRASEWQVHSIGLALMLCLFGSLLPARGQDPRLTLTNHPMDTNVSVGVTVSFRVYATTTNPPLTFQWQHDNVDIPGATNYTLILPSVTLADAGGYKAIVWNANRNSTNSRTATLTVDPTFTKITQGPLVTENLDDHAVAWGDYDGDGDLDVVVTGGYWGSGSFISTLYTNRGNGTFTGAAPNPFSASADGLCVNWADADNDGDLDLWLGVNEASYPQFFTNRGNATFTRTAVNPTWITNGVNVRGGMQAWADYDGDGLLDLAVVPLGNDPATRKPIALLHNSGNGRFAAVTNSPLYEEKKYSSSASWVDLDDDGDPDLICLGDFPIGFQNEGGTLIPMASTELSPIAGAKMDAWADFDNDGDLDVLVTYWRAPMLCRNDGHGRWTLMEGPLYDAFQGVGSSTEGNCAAWGDYDNDGDLDLFVVTGVEGQANRNHLFRNDGAAGFVEVLTGNPVNDRARSYQCVWVDYDNDGDLDLHVLNSYNGATTINDFLYRNNGSTNHWLEVKLSGRVSNRSAIGAKVRVKAVIGGKEVWQLRTISAQAWTQELVAHIGLGDADRAEILRIEWPSGIVQETTGVAANQILSLAEEQFLVTSSIPEVRPGRVDVPEGDAATLGVSATPATATYQWRFNGEDIPGAVAATLSIASLSATDLGRYTVLIATADLRVYARPVDLGMLGRPVIVGPDAITPSSVSLGAPVVLRAKVTGATPLVLQWQLNGVDIPATANPSAATSELRIEGATLGDAGDYRLIVSNVVDTVLSTTVSIQVDPTFTKITTGPVVEDKLICWGLLWGDYDNDNNVDLLLSNDAGGGKRSPNFLYRNQGDGSFTRETNSLFHGDLGAYGGGAWADFNNDAYLDCYVPDVIRAYSANATANHLLYLGGPAGSFTKVSAGPAGSQVRMAWDTTWGDFDNDGLVDLFAVGAWTGFNTHNYLFRNKGNLTFERVTQGRIVTDSADSELVAASDYDGDGDLDLLVSSHSQRLLYQNNGDGTFARDTTGPIALDTGNSAGPAWGDYDNDGQMDLCLATFDEKLHLFHNDGAGKFTRSLLGPSSNYQIPSWADYDNDGWLDLFVTQGNGLGELRNRLYHNNGDGTFTEVRTGSLANEGGYSFASAWADYDNDGFLDLVVGNFQANASAFLYRNNGNSNHWLMVKLVGTTSNRSAIGAKVRAQAALSGRPIWQLREITGGGHRSQNDLRAHFGLGNAANVTTLRIEWPSGTVQEIANVTPNQILTVLEPRRPVLAVAVTSTQVTGTLTGDTNQVYQIQASDDIATGWTVLTTVTTDTSGTGNWSDPGVAPQGRRFYKALKIP